MGSAAKCLPQATSRLQISVVRIYSQRGLCNETINRNYHRRGCRVQRSGCPTVLPNSLHSTFSASRVLVIIPRMKKNHTALPPEESIADLAHFAWCALVSLRLTQQDGQTLSPLTIHTFLLRWLATAQKQRRFPRSVASDIDSLLRLGRHQGPAAGLLKRLEYLHQSCTEPLAHQSDLFRLTLAIEYLKAQGWVNAVVSDEEWEPGALYTEYADVSALLVKKSELQRHFTEQGQQSAPVEFIVVGDPRVAGDAFDARELRYTTGEQRAGWCLLSLLPAADANVPAVQIATGK